MAVTDNKKAVKNKLNAKKTVEPAHAFPAFFLKKAKNELNAESFMVVLLLWLPVNLSGRDGLSNFLSG